MEARVQGVQDAYEPSLGEGGVDDVRTDESGTAGDEEPHRADTDSCVAGRAMIRATAVRSISGRGA